MGYRHTYSRYCAYMSWFQVQSVQVKSAQVPLVLVQPFMRFQYSSLLIAVNIVNSTSYLPFSTIELLSHGFGDVLTFSPFLLSYLSFSLSQLSTVLVMLCHACHLPLRLSSTSLSLCSLQRPAREMDYSMPATEERPVGYVLTSCHRSLTDVAVQDYMNAQRKGFLLASLRSLVDKSFPSMD